MDDRTLTALYDTRGVAEAARNELIRLGVPADGVSLRPGQGDATTATGSDTTTTGDASGGRGFWGSLSDLFMPDEDRDAYVEGMRRGGVLLSASVPAGLEDEAIAVLERSGAVDIDERSASWRESGWTGQASDYGVAAGATATPAAGAGHDDIGKDQGVADTGGTHGSGGGRFD